MEFLRSLVPTVISGEGVAPETALSREKGAALLRETGPRLLSMKRLSLLAMSSTIQEEDVSARPPRPTGLRGTQDRRGQRSARERGVRKGEREGRIKRGVRGHGLSSAVSSGLVHRWWLYCRGVSHKRPDTVISS